MNVSQDDYAALLMCVALHGYHAIVSYQWSKDGYELLDEVHPLLYTTSIGKYTCCVTSKKESVKHFFEVKGDYLVHGSLNTCTI